MRNSYIARASGESEAVDVAGRRSRSLAGARGQGKRIVWNLTLRPALTVLSSWTLRTRYPQAPTWYPPTQLCVEGRQGRPLSRTGAPLSFPLAYALFGLLLRS